MATENHFVLGSPMRGPYPEDSQKFIMGMGCFWGAEKLFWPLEGIITTAVGYSNGHTKAPTYAQVCSGTTGHNEVVLVVFDARMLSLEKLLKIFWESHNPTQWMRQGNDIGPQYRSGLYYFGYDQAVLAKKTQINYQQRIERNLGKTLKITTEIQAASTFYFAEDMHQQYLAKHPNGYCGLKGLEIS